VLSALSGYNISSYTPICDIIISYRIIITFKQGTS